METIQAHESFRFNPDRHEYTDARGRVLPHITGMLERTGWIDSTWYSEESSARGTAVHSLTADYDMGALEAQSCSSVYKPWLLAYVAAMEVLRRPVWSAIEAPVVHPDLRFAGRPDRVGTVFGAYTILEIKTNNKGWNLERAHPIQTALQALLVSAAYPLPPEEWQRYALYCRPDGRWRVIEHKDTRKDFDEARRIIRACTR